MTIFLFNTKSNRKYVWVKLNGHSVRLQIDTASDIILISQRLWKTIDQPSQTPRRHVARSSSGDYVHTGKLPATIEIEDITAPRVTGLLDIPLNPVCNIVSRSTAQSAITEQIDDTIKRFSPLFTNDLGRCTQTEVTLTLKLSATPVFQSKRLKQPWSRIHMDFAGLINGCSFLVVVNPHSKWPEIFPMKNADTCWMIVILKRLFSQHGLLERLASDNYNLHPRHFSPFAVHTASHMFSHHSTTHNPMVKWNVSWIPLNLLNSKKKGGNNNQGDIEYMSPFVPNNTKCYKGGWNVSSRNIHGTKALDHTGCFTPTKTGKKDCLSMTWKLVNNSGHGIETSYGPDTLTTTRLTTCQPFH